jgi:hypothetical protein
MSWVSGIFDFVSRVVDDDRTRLGKKIYCGSVAFIYSGVCFRPWRSWVLIPGRFFFLVAGHLHGDLGIFFWLLGVSILTWAYSYHDPRA